MVFGMLLGEKCILPNAGLSVRIAWARAKHLELIKLRLKRMCRVRDQEENSIDQK